MLRDAMPAAMIAVACAVGTVVFASRTRPDPDRDVAKATAPLVPGVRAGERIAGWDVEAIASATDGAALVTMAQGGMSFVLTVAPLGLRAENPPFSTATHAIYYGHARPAGAQIPAGALRAITAELMRRLSR